MDFSKFVKKSLATSSDGIPENQAEELKLFAPEISSWKGENWGELWWGTQSLGFSAKKKVQLVKMEDGGRLPCPSQKFDMFLTPTGLNGLRKDSLYMLLAELRRVLVPGGLWVAMVREDSHTGKPTSPPGLDLSHFISPEDWEILKEKALRIPNGTYRYFELQRMPE